MMMSIAAFKSSTTSRACLQPLQMALNLETIHIPVQLNPRDYVIHLKKVIPEEEIIRWYIARIEDGDAIIEVVREMK